MKITEAQRNALIDRLLELYGEQVVWGSDDELEADADSLIAAIESAPIEAQTEETPT